jgi:hypothetical protein
MLRLMTVPFESSYGYGVVFSITPSGTQKVLHSFGNGRQAHLLNDRVSSLSHRLRHCLQHHAGW